MELLINPLELRDMDSPFLIELLLGNPSNSNDANKNQNTPITEYVWDQDLPHRIYFRGKPIDILLTSTITKQESKSGPLRYNFIHNSIKPINVTDEENPSELLGAGVEGAVYPVTHMQIVNNELINKETPSGHSKDHWDCERCNDDTDDSDDTHALVAKIIPLPEDPKERKAAIKKAHQEYLMASKTSHLHPHPPLISQKCIILFSRRMDGHLLHDVQTKDIQALKQIYRHRIQKSHQPTSSATNLPEPTHALSLANKQILSLEQRFDLSIALLQALKDEVYTKDLVHRDIEPNNIFINFKTKQAHIIDYGSAKAKDASCVNETPEGTPHYISPEGQGLDRIPELSYPTSSSNKQRVKNLFNLHITTALSDVYSMGRVLAPIWGIDPCDYFKTHSEEATQNKATDDYASLFKLIEQIQPLSTDAASLIKKTLQQMTAYHAENRITLPEALDAFTRAKYLQGLPENDKHERTNTSAGCSFKNRWVHFSPKKKQDTILFNPNYAMDEPRSI